MGDKSGTTGPNNGMWKGGRSISSHGYVLIRVGRHHHLADVRGYAYEHRVVAEKMLGRRLTDGEQVHHANGIKDDNRPENLQVMADISHHRFAHRTTDTDRRRPGQKNPVICCECGCGELFPRFDQYGRPRSFISGHNMRRCA